METVEVLRWVLAGLYTALAIAAAQNWLGSRSRSAAYLGSAFLCLAGAVGFRQMVSLSDGAAARWLTEYSLVLLLAAPWLLAAFAWSFTRARPPRWLIAAGLGQALLAVVLITLHPFEGPGSQGFDRAYPWVVVVAWLALCLAAAVKLWRAEPRHRPVRVRTRTMAVGTFVLGATVAVAATTPANEVTAVLLPSTTMLAGLLFYGAFAAPRPLRWWWGQLPTSQVTHMQTSLIAATTPREVAEAIVPAVASLYGAGVIFLDPDGRSLASAGADTDRLQALAGSLAAGTSAPGLLISEVEGYRLGIDSSPYAPMFGGLEHDLLKTVQLQLRLALQRAALTSANETARLALQQASEDQQAMLIGLTHDLRSPTVTIAAYSALLQDATDIEEAREMAADIAVSAGYLDRLVDGLSELSRIGRCEQALEPVALDEVVDRTTDRLSATHPGLRVLVEGDLPVLRADRLQAEQLVDNLLCNAAKHAGRPDVTVTISADTSPRGTTIVIADDGHGIPEDEHEAVFRLFRQASTSEATGSGVGLSLIRRIVTSLGGSIRLTPSDTGARFEVTLPTSALDQTAGDLQAAQPSPVADS